VNVPETAPLYFPDQLPLRCGVALRVAAAITPPARASTARVETAAAIEILRRCIAGASLFVCDVVLTTSLRRQVGGRKE